jgi:hypothetical protein
MALDEEPGRPRVWPSRGLRALARTADLDPNAIASVIIARAGFPKRGADLGRWERAFIAICEAALRGARNDDDFDFEPDEDVTS